MNGSIRDLASQFRLARRSGGYGGDCPVCGYASAFTARPARNGRTLMHCFNGCDWTVLHDAARAAIGGCWTPPPGPDGEVRPADDQARQDRAQCMWQSSQQCPGTLAEVYLARRGIGHVAAAEALRFNPNCPHPGGTRAPALITAVQAADGTIVAVHRTYLRPDGRKATLDPPKASLGPVRGGAIRLAPVMDEVVIGEGIESAASAGIMLGVPAWAAINAGNLSAGLTLPNHVRVVTVAADRDLNGVGQRAAHDAAARWRATGRTVRVIIPDRPGQDFNDVLRERAQCPKA